MATQTQRFDFHVPEFVTQGLETGRARLKDLESQAQEVWKDLYARGNKEILELKDRLPLDGLRERVQVEEMVSRVRKIEDEAKNRVAEVADDFDRRMGELQERTLSVVGVASRDQVHALARDLDRLARRLDKLARENRRGPAAQKSPAKGTKAPAKGAKAAGRSPKRAKQS